MANRFLFPKKCFYSSTDVFDENEGEVDCGKFSEDIERIKERLNKASSYTHRGSIIKTYGLIASNVVHVTDYKDDPYDPHDFSELVVHY